MSENHLRELHEHNIFQILMNLAQIESTKERMDYVSDVKGIIAKAVTWYLTYAGTEECWEIVDTVKSLILKDSLARNRLKNAERFAFEGDESVIFLSSIEDIDTLLGLRENTLILNFYYTEYFDFYLLYAWLENGVRKVEKHRFASGNDGKCLYDELLNLRNAMVKFNGNHSTEIALESAINKITDIFGNLIFSIIAHLKISVQRVIIIPDKLLYSVPLHASSVKIDGRQIFLDEIVSEIVYGPSACCLCVANCTPIRPDKLLYCVDTENLPDHGRLELEYFRAAWGEHGNGIQIATLDTELPQDLSSYGSIFWSSHAFSDPTDWSQSALLFGKSSYSFDKIADSWNLHNCYLAILAACETGSPFAQEKVYNDYCGVDMALQIAGCRVIFSTLWKVRDLTASFFTISLVENMFGLNILPSRAICQLQTNLRSGAWKALTNESYKLHKDAVNRNKYALRLLEYLLDASDDAFISPLDWAVFRCLGVSEHTRSNILFL